MFFSNIKNLRTTEHFQRIYIKSHHRITTYLIGMVTAYVYMRVKKSNYIFSMVSIRLITAEFFVKSRGNCIMFLFFFFFCPLRKAERLDLFCALHCILHAISWPATYTFRGSSTTRGITCCTLRSRESYTPRPFRTWWLSVRYRISVIITLFHIIISYCRSRYYPPGKWVL